MRTRVGCWAETSSLACVVFKVTRHSYGKRKCSACTGCTVLPIFYFPFHVISSLYISSFLPNSPHFLQSSLSLLHYARATLHLLCLPPLTLFYLSVPNFNHLMFPSIIFYTHIDNSCHGKSRLGLFWRVIFVVQESVGPLIHFKRCHHETENPIGGTELVWFLA